MSPHRALLAEAGPNLAQIGPHEDEKEDEDEEREEDKDKEDEADAAKRHPMVDVRRRGGPNKVAPTPE